MSRTDISSGNFERLQVVDVLRGFALSALFLVHMLEGYELYWIDPDPSWASRAVFLLFMGKSFPLLSIGFGFSFYMLIDRQGTRPSQNSLWFAWRLVILELIGCAHALIYSGDIIEVLATLGLPLLLIAKIKSTRILMAIAILCFLQPLQWWDFAANGPGLVSAPASSGGNTGVYAYHGGLTELVRANIWVGQVTKWHFMLVSGRISQIFGLYIVGLMLGRANFFARLTQLRRARTIALVAGLAAAIGFHTLGAWVLRNGPDMENAGVLMAILEGWEDLAATACWGLAICALWQSSARMTLIPLANVGRATLTLYILQSLIFIPLFYPFGADLYAAWNGPTRLFAGLVAIGTQVCIANLWFKRFRYGPVEWAWRAATDLRTDIPFRRLPAGARPVSELDLQPTPSS